MAERTILVCDVCGAPASQTVRIKVGDRSLQKDLCDVHFGELTAGARAPKRGRRAGTTTAVTTPTRKSRAKQAPKASPNGRRRRKASAAKSSRRQITDPAVLEKRRAALAKAREVLAQKRSAAAKSR